MAETNKGLYKKRFATLKEHKAAVAARKALKAGKNKGPVANADAYGETLKKAKPKAKPVTKPTSTKAVRSASTSTNSAKTKAQKAISGVGPSNAQRRKDSSPKAMAAYDKRAKAVDGPGPSRAERKKSMSPKAMATSEKAKSKPTKPKSKSPSGRVALAARQAEKRKTKSYKDPRSETRTRYVRTAGGGKKAIHEIKINGKYVKAGGKG